MNHALLARPVALLMCVAMLAVLGCASAPAPRTQPGEVPSYYHLRSAGATPARAWVMLLPGASGLTIFEDDQHYFRAADALTAEGFDVLIVDYKAAYRAANPKPAGPARDKIAWAIEHAGAWMRDRDHASQRPWAIVAWSLGAEGLWPLLESRAEPIGCLGAAAYYPSNEDHVPIRAGVPLLVFGGEKDDVTPAEDIRAAVSAAQSPRISLHFYPGALHGFDIESLAQPRTVSLIPLIGPHATFGYNKAAADDAARRLHDFLAELMKSEPPRAGNPGR